MKILIAEDHADLRQSIAARLRAKGHSVDQACNLAEARDQLSVQDYSVAILDRMLPDGDAICLLDELRTRRDTTPVLFLTARDQISDRVEGLQAGADDYLVKPFALDELLARVRSLSRRVGAAGALLRYADIEVDLELRTATRGGKNLELRPREFALLRFFMEHPEKVLSRARIYEKVWESKYDGATNVIEVYVRYLRTALEAHGPRVIHTVRGRGYELRREDAA